jgi:hypothetical protein
MSNTPRSHSRDGRFPRSCLEAWPGHYPQSITCYRRTWRDHVPSVLLACAIGIGLAVVLFYSLSA